jgi:hypothetical protein
MDLQNCGWEGRLLPISLEAWWTRLFPITRQLPAKENSSTPIYGQSGQCRPKLVTWTCGALYHPSWTSGALYLASWSSGALYLASLPSGALYLASWSSGALYLASWPSCALYLARGGSAEHWILPADQAAHEKTYRSVDRRCIASFQRVLRAACVANLSPCCWLPSCFSLQVRVPTDVLIIHIYCTNTVFCYTL